MTNSITLEDFFNDNVSYKEVIDYVEDKLTAQGRCSGSRNAAGVFNCLYRDELDDKCAVGHLISDSRYNPSMEDERIGESFIAHFYPDLIPNINNIDKIEFLKSMQRAHDSSQQKSSFIFHIQQEFNKIRKSYNVN